MLGFREPSYVFRGAFYARLRRAKLRISRQGVLAATDHGDLIAFFVEDHLVHERMHQH